MKTPPGQSPIRRLSSGLGALSASLLLSAAGANAALVFEADYNGSDSGSGGASDVVALGGTGTITGNNPNFVASDQSANPLDAGSGNYLNSLWPSTGAAGGSGFFANYTPASAASSLASFVGANIVNGPNTFVNLNGGFDEFARLDIKDVGTTGGPGDVGRSATWLSGFYTVTTISGSNGMALTFSGLGYGAIRLQLDTGAAAGITNYTKLSAGNGSVSFASGNVAYMDGTADYFNDPNNYHLGLTFSTDANGLITAKVFARQDFGAIDTTSDADLQYAATFNLDATAIGPNPIDSGAWHQAGFVSAAGAGASADYDTMRLYDSAPASFDALAAVPEPGILALAASAAGFLGLTALWRRSQAGREPQPRVWSPSIVQGPMPFSSHPKRPFKQFS
ncbi:MAG: hypothetical protein PHC88_04680 [Terrimicrobiaceae bacterium]|nr:hypothetical protein [Terrimicrobiaceae bacterium]